MGTMRVADLHSSVMCAGDVPFGEKFLLHSIFFRSPGRRVDGSCWDEVNWQHASVASYIRREEALSSAGLALPSEALGL